MITVSTITTLTDYAQDLLGVCENALATTIGGVPDRSYITPSEPAWDCCPFLNVQVGGLTEAPTSPLGPAEAPALRTKFGNVILARYVITAVRCSPTVNGTQLPTVAAMNASAAEVLEDGWALWNGLRHAIEDNLIFDGCLGVHFDGAQPLPDQGGCVGWRMVIRASIPGIPN
jgi:hypothetical protein